MTDPDLSVGGNAGRAGPDPSAHHQTGYNSGSASVVWVGGYPTASLGPSHHSVCFLIDPNVSVRGNAGRAVPASSAHHQTGYHPGSAPPVLKGGNTAALTGNSHHSVCYMIDPNLSVGGNAGRAGPAPSANHQTGYDSGSASVVWMGGYPTASSGPSHHSVCFLIDPHVSVRGNAGRAVPAPSAYQQNGYHPGPVYTVLVGGYPAALKGPSHHLVCYMTDSDLSVCGNAGRAGPAPSAHHQTGYNSGSASVVWVGGYPTASPGPSHHSDCCLIDPNLSVGGNAGRAGPAPSAHHKTG